MSRIEEYDDGYDSAASFEAAGADRPEDCEDPADSPVELGEAVVWHEGSRSFYRARLLEKLTPEEALFDPND